MRAVGDRVIGDKLKLRSIAKLKTAAQLPTQKAGGGFESLQNILFLRLVQYADIYLGIARSPVVSTRVTGDHTHLRDPGVLQPA